MLKFVDSALSDADVLLYVTDVVETIGKAGEYLDKVNRMDCPVLLLINKIDLTNQQKLEELVDSWKNLIPRAEVFPVSALNKFNIEPVLKRLIELVPQSPPYFPKDQLTDKTERFFMQEIIREKIFMNYDKEIPYSCEVNVEEFKEQESIIKTRAIIYVARDSQKGIIIGHKGSMLKKVGTAARIEAETFFDKKIFLEMHVKVLKDWRDKDINLRSFGYEQK